MFFLVLLQVLKVFPRSKVSFLCVLRFFRWFSRFLKGCSEVLKGYLGCSRVFEGFL